MKGRNKLVIITGLLLLVVALIVFLIAGYLAGWDIAGWFESQMAIWCYVLVGLYLIFVALIFIKEWVDKL